MATVTRNAAFKRIKAVTLPVLKLVKDTPRYLKITGPMTLGKKIDDQKEAATIVAATDLETGEQGLVICPTVMQKELIEAYPGDAYVGKCFEVILTRVPDKRYNIVSITEVAEPDGSTDAQKASDAELNATAAASDAELNATAAASAKKGK